ncbi:MAG: hypothetical protein KF757_03415 [Phycisphaeraceae bacterium]|nr:hypothetical protein [Phycisphaeraceae bacterium]MCW5763052.1 hypothetical protein [Phycisphaeraceae bacterium]
MNPRHPIVLVIAVLALSACQRHENPPPPLDAAISSRSDSALGSLHIVIPSGEMRTVDTIDVSITISTAPGVVITSFAFNPAAHGWTILHETSQPPTMSQTSMLVEQRLLTIEPFLPGDYEIPSVTAVLRSRDGTSASLETSPQTVRVVSVLTEADKDLAPVRPLLDEPRQAVLPSILPTLIWGGTLLAIVIVAAFVLVLRAHKRPKGATAAKPRSLYDDTLSDPEFARIALGLIASKIHPLEQVSCDAITTEDIIRAINRRDSNPVTSQLVGLLHKLDAAQYSGDSLSKEQRATIRSAIEQLHSPPHTPEAAA